MLTLKFLFITLAIIQWLRFKAFKSFSFDEEKGYDLFQSLLLVFFTIAAVISSVMLILKYLP